MNYSRKKNKFLFRLLKYEKFTNEFIRFYNKYHCGIKASWFKVKKLNLEIKIPSWRQVFNWVKYDAWVINKAKRLRKKYRKGRRRKIGFFSKFKNKFVLPIWVRPKFIDKRQEYGHWEVDLVIGKKANGFENLLTFTERMSRKLYMVKVKSKDPYKINSVIKNLVDQNQLTVKSITCDNGHQFLKIGLLAKWIKCLIYYCEPYASFQRGTNENINGLIRRYWKKGADFNLVNPSEVFQVQENINNMPREMFKWHSSNEIDSLLKI